MTYNTKGRFRCKHCGDRFDLPTDEMILYAEGWYDGDPDVCDECAEMVHDAYLDNMYSDADPGL